MKNTQNGDTPESVLEGASFSIPVSSFNLKDKAKIEASVTFEAKTAAPDGMIFDQKGNLYYADLEHNKIDYITPNGTIKTLVEGDKVKWADTFSIYDGYLYYTNSRINEASGDISDLKFTINKVDIHILLKGFPDTVRLPSSHQAIIYKYAS